MSIEKNNYVKWPRNKENMPRVVTIGARRCLRILDNTKRKQTWHSLTTVSPRPPQSHHSLTTVSPQSHHSLTTVSPQSHHSLTTVSPQSHYILTTVLQQSHHSLTTVSSQSHHSLTTVSPQSPHSLTTVSPQSHHSLTTFSPQSYNSLTTVSPQSHHSPHSLNAVWYIFFPFSKYNRCTLYTYCIHTYSHTYIHTHTSTYIHTYIHTYIQRYPLVQGISIQVHTVCSLKLRPYNKGGLCLRRPHIGDYSSTSYKSTSVVMTNLQL